jgi:hypothetical protein
LNVVKRRTAKGKKYYPQYHRENGAWVSGALPGPRIPYRLPELVIGIKAGKDIHVTEGEKDANRLAALGLVATTNPEGATKFPDYFKEWFKGAKRVNVHIDNDKAGEKHGEIVARVLAGVVPDIRIVRYSETKGHGDVSDWLDAGHTLEELIERAEATTPHNDGELDSINASDVTILNVEWLWRNRFGRGKIGLLVGLPDEGKGQTLCNIMATVSRGRAWPMNEGISPQGSVVIFSDEDGREDTLVPRLKAAGADLSKIEIIKMVKDPKGERLFSLVDDLEKLRAKIKKVVTYCWS